jgi:hypothetical protein
MHCAVRSGRNDALSIVAASGRFGNFKPESERNVTAPEIKQGMTLENFIRIWRKVVYDGRIAQYTSDVESLLAGFEWTAKDVTAFSIALAQFQNEGDSPNVRAGLLLSALIGNCPEGEHEVFTGHLTILPQYLGYANKKIIDIYGDAGHYLGICSRGGRITLHGDAGPETATAMTGGILIIRGNCGSFLGINMIGGRIVVEGNAGNAAGAYMKKGYADTSPSIHVKGNAGEAVGHLMTAGEIRIEGGYGSIGDVIAGRIYYGDELIADK